MIKWLSETTEIGTHCLLDLRGECQCCTMCSGVHDAYVLVCRVRCAPGRLCAAVPRRLGDALSRNIHHSASVGSDSLHCSLDLILKGLG
eukprot:m.1258298 g.1258298  ORF g.1258298 m.1258298 type:complete len:89 (-) comp24718_c0_seq4:1324-1590(-)